MPSRAFIEEAMKQDTDKVYLCCLTIAHPDLDALAATTPDLDSPILVVNDGADLERASGTFRAWGFGFKEPDEGEDAKPRAQILLDNIDRRYIAVLRQIDTPATITAEIVLAHAPDTVERVFDEFELVLADWDRQQIVLNIAFRDDDDEAACAWLFTAGLAPGLY